jgi:hypothetical protein
MFPIDHGDVLTVGGDEGHADESMTLVKFG